MKSLRSEGFSDRGFGHENNDRKIREVAKLKFSKPSVERLSERFLKKELLRKERTSSSRKNFSEKNFSEKHGTAKPLSVEAYVGSLWIYSGEIELATVYDRFQKAGGYYLIALSTFECTKSANLNLDRCRTTY
jgi:hypothetical protein